MFPRFSKVTKLLIGIVVILIISFVVLLQRTEVATRRHRRLPWEDEIIIERTLNEHLPPHRKTHTSGISQNRPWTSKPQRQTSTTHNTESHSVSTTSRIVNAHKFNYIINPTTLCSNKEVYLVTYIHTAPKNFKKRQTIRMTWGSRQESFSRYLILVFIMGKVPDQRIMDSVQLESERYGDIVQEDFVDAYRNLTYKAIAGLKWVSSYCKQAVYVLKTDDDILVNIEALLTHLRGNIQPQHGTQRLIMCNQWLRMKVLRDKNSKWYIPPEDFAPDYFPPYCSGSAFVMSSDVVRSMYDVSFYTPFFWVDDYYITGMLVQKLNLKHTRFNSAYILNARVVSDKFKNDTNHSLVFFHIHKLGSMYKMWREIQTRMNSTHMFRHPFTWSITTHANTKRWSR
jgi:hypothetical protein